MGLALGDQPGDPAGQHPGLARAGAGDDEQRRALVDDGGPLRLVEALEQLARGSGRAASCAARRGRRTRGRGAGSGCSCSVPTLRPRHRRRVRRGPSDQKTATQTLATGEQRAAAPTGRWEIRGLRVLAITRTSSTSPITPLTATLAWLTSPSPDSRTPTSEQAGDERRADTVAHQPVDRLLRACATWIEQAAEQGGEAEQVDDEQQLAQEIHGASLGAADQPLRLGSPRSAPSGRSRLPKRYSITKSTTPTPTRPAHHSSDVGSS